MNSPSARTAGYWSPSLSVGPLPLTVGYSWPSADAERWKELILGLTRCALIAYRPWRSRAKSTSLGR
jgi:hypothetical protein